MELSTHFLSFQIFDQNLHTLYHRLRVSAFKIFDLVQSEINLINIYNPKNGNILEAENKYEFESFQETLRNLNNIVYYNSLLLGSYSIFETSFKNLCKFVEEYSNPKIEPFKIQNDTLSDCRKYLFDSGLVDFKSKEIKAKYDEITKVKKLRNLIAHNNSNLIRDKFNKIEKQPNYKLFKRQPCLTVMNNGQVYINDDEYIKIFIEESEKFIKLIIGELKRYSTKH